MHDLLCGRSTSQPYLQNMVQLDPEYPFDVDEGTMDDDSRPHISPTKRARRNAVHDTGALCATHNKCPFRMVLPGERKLPRCCTDCRNAKWHQSVFIVSTMSDHQARLDDVIRMEHQARACAQASVRDARVRADCAVAPAEHIDRKHFDIRGALWLSASVLRNITNLIATRLPYNIALLKTPLCFLKGL